MANYNRYSKRQSVKKKYRNINKSKDGVFKIILMILIIFLPIGFIASVFRRPSADLNINATESPTTSVTDPTDPEEATDPTEDATDSTENSGDALLMFSVNTEVDGDPMTWQQFFGDSSDVDASKHIEIPFG